MKTLLLNLLHGIGLGSLAACLFAAPFARAGHTNVAHYSFEDNNLFAHDFSGRGNNINSYGWFEDPPHMTNDAVSGSYAVGYTGTGWQSPPTNLVAMLADSFSISLWVRTSDNPGNDDDPANLGAGLVSANWDQVIPMALTGSKLAFFTGGDAPDTLHSVTSINTGLYVHLVVTRNAESGEKKIYVNGNLDATGFGPTGPLGTAQTPSLYLGMNSTFADGLVGDMDEIQFFSGVLFGSEVAYLYNHPGSTVADTTGQDFNAALNTTGFTWIPDGDTSWFVETTHAHDGVSAAQSGVVTNHQTSTLSVTVTGPGTLTFYWSSQSTGVGFDYEFDIDGNYADDIDWNTPWHQDGPFNIPDGQRTLRWSVSARGDNDPTEAGFLDQVQFTPSPGQLINPQLVGANFQFSFQSQSTFTHSVFYRTNLVSGAWQTYTNMPGDGTVKTIQIPLSTFSPSRQGFVRVSTQ